MMAFLRNLLPFVDRRSRYQRVSDRVGPLARRVGTKRGGLLGFGTLASIAAPFIIRKIRQRRAARVQGVGGVSAAY